MALSDRDKSFNIRPSVTPEQKKRWNDEATSYANKGGGGIKQFLTDYARNAGQLGSGAVDVAGGVISVPFAAAADGINNGARALLGAGNTNPSKYRQQSYHAVNGGLNNIMDVANRTGAGTRDLLGWQKQNSNPTQVANQIPQGSNTIETIPMTPQQQANYNYYNEGSQPTSVKGVRALLNNNTPLFTNIKPSFDKEGNELPSPQMINTIPSFMPSGKETKQQSPVIPFYDQGTQAHIIEDSTTGGYYQRRRADNKNKKTIDLLNNANKENWGLNRQAILDDSQLQQNAEANRVLSTQAETAERINNLDHMLADFRLPQQQRLAALQTRGLLSQGAQQQQRNAVNVVTDEMNDGSKKQRVVVTDPSTGDTIGGNTQQVNRSDIAKLAQASGKTEQQVMDELRGLGVDII